MTQPLFTVVVPAFGVVATLRASVISALGASTSPLEVIIVDDGSTDGTRNVSDELAQREFVTVVHRSSAGGPVAARNEGLRKANGEFVLFLDGDDTLTTGALDRLRATIGNQHVAALGRFQAVNEAGDFVDIGTWATEQLRPVLFRHHQFTPSEEGFSDEAILTRLVTPPPGGVLLRRSALHAVQGYNPRARRSEDLDLLVRLTSVGTIVSCDDVVLHYRRTASQRSASHRRRQFGRQWTMLMLVLHAPTRQRARARARGVAAHHWDRAQTRWRFGKHAPRDAVAAARSLLFVGLFRLVGVSSWLWIRIRRNS